MAIVIVFTVYKNGGNAGVFGASFSCALFGVRGGSGVNSGALVVPNEGDGSIVLEIALEIVRRCGRSCDRVCGRY